MDATRLKKVTGGLTGAALVAGLGATAAPAQADPRDPGAGAIDLAPAAQLALKRPSALPDLMRCMACTSGFEPLVLDHSLVALLSQPGR